MIKHIDYYVRTLSEEQVVESALAWRRRAEQVLGDDYFGMVDFLKGVLQKDLRSKDPLKIDFTDRDASGPIAKVGFRPLKLTVNPVLFERARNSDPVARYVLAHECGHVVLHDHHAKGFSGSSSGRIPLSNREQSAEWQADKFADHLLAPLKIVSRYKRSDEIVIRCGVPIEVAERQLELVDAYLKRHGKAYGESCSGCYGCDTWMVDGRVHCRSCGQQQSII